MGFIESIRRRWFAEKDEGISQGDLTREFGAPGTSIWHGVITEEYVIDLSGTKKYDVYKRMRNDSQVMATLLVMELPIRSAEWEVKPGEGNKGEEIAEFVRENLFERMSITFDDFIRQALLMLSYGFMLFEKVFEVEDGYLKWRKFAPRMPWTISKWLTDENGGLAGVHQRVYGDTDADVDIPVEKLLLFTNRMEGNNFEGVSFLRAAYKNWWYKDLLYKLAGMAAERTGVGVPYIQLPQGWQPADRDVAKTIVKSIRANEEEGVVLPPGYNLDILQGKEFPYLDLIEHHDRMIAKSVLAQFLNLGQDRVGSYALSKSQTDLFLMSLRSLAKQICNVINRYAIKQLVELNWGADAPVPELFCKLPVQNIDAIAEAAEKLVNASLLTPDENLEDFMRDVMDLPPRPEKGEEVGEPPESEEEIKQHERREHPIVLGEAKRFWRPLTKYEDRESLVRLNEQWDIFEDLFSEQTEEVLEKQLEDLRKQIEAAVAQADMSKLKAVSPKYARELKKIIRDLFVQAAEWARDQVEREYRLRIPELANKIVRWANARADIIGDRMANDIRETLLRAIFDDKELMSEIIAGQVGAQTLKKVDSIAADVLKWFKDRKLGMVGAAVVGEGIRTGRDLIAQHPEIMWAQRSEVLDENTCSQCRKLDGIIVRVNSPEFARYSPPNYCLGSHQCRGVWVYIKRTETPPPEVTRAFPKVEERLPYY